MKCRTVSSDSQGIAKVQRGSRSFLPDITDSDHTPTKRRRAAAWHLSRMHWPRVLFATSPSVPWESRRVCSCDADTKTAVDKDTVAVSRQNDVGIARRVSLIEPKPVAHEMQQPSDNQLGLGVFAQMRLMSWLRCCGLKVSAMQLRLLRILIKARWGNARSNVLGHWLCWCRSRPEAVQRGRNLELNQCPRTGRNQIASGRLPSF